ncbi:MAG: putative sulfate/molybdate transporter [Halodesulfurarchaeum sp.]
MPLSVLEGREGITLAWNEVTGAIGDSVTVLPILIGVGALSDLSVSWMLVWFGIFQIVWGLYYGVPVSVEPMKALAALVLAGTMSTGEVRVAGLLLGGVLLGIGRTGTLGRIGRYIHSPVIRGIQFGVALVLLETGLRLSAGNVQLALLAAGLAAALILLGHWNVTALIVLAVGGVIVGVQTGVPDPALPSAEGMVLLGETTLTASTIEAAMAQFAMTVGNAALAASVLLRDYFDREVSPDQLSSSMGVMNLVGLPFGAFPMCHGSGGIAGKYAFGARTAGANIVLGVGYIALSVIAGGLVAAYPVSILGIILVLVAVQLGRTSMERTNAHLVVIGIGVLGVVVNLGVAFVAGILATFLFDRFGPERLL